MNPWSFFKVGEIQWYEGKVPAAEQALRKVTELNPTASDVHIVLAAVLLCDGQGRAVLDEMDKDSDADERQVLRPLMLEALGQRAAADRELKTVELKYGGSAAHEIALTYAYRGDADRAFAWLDRPWRNHESILLLLKGDSLLKNLNGDPRFPALVRKMGLPE